MYLIFPTTGHVTFSSQYYQQDSRDHRWRTDEVPVRFDGVVIRQDRPGRTIVLDGPFVELLYTRGGGLLTSILQFAVEDAGRARPEAAHIHWVNGGIIQWHHIFP